MRKIEVAIGAAMLMAPRYIGFSETNKCVHFDEEFVDLRVKRVSYNLRHIVTIFAQSNRYERLVSGRSGVINTKRFTEMPGKI